MSLTKLSTDKVTDTISKKFTGMRNMGSMPTGKKVYSILWALTGILLVVLIAVQIAWGNSKTMSQSNTIAAVLIAFVVLLFGAIIATVIVSMQKQRAKTKNPVAKIIATSNTKQEISGTAKAKSVASTATKAKPAPTATAKAKPTPTITTKVEADSILTRIRGFGSRSIGFLGRIGKALLFPIAALPIAALLLRLGSAVPDTTVFSAGVGNYIAQSGSFVFDNLHVIFATGVAFGLTKDNRGEAALVGLLGILLLSVLMRTGGVDLSTKIYSGLDLSKAPLAPENALGFHRVFTATQQLTREGVGWTTSTVDGVSVATWGAISVPTGAAGTDRFDAILSNNVLAGFAAGGIIAFLYNRFNGVRLPSVLGFFSGRRLVPVIGILSIMVFAIFWAIVFPWLGYLLYLLSDALANASQNRFGRAAVMGVYAVLNRLLIPFGLHHIPNTIFWFTLDAKVNNAAGNAVFGDIFGFINGVPQGNTSGTFQTGFFPIMMFGLPAMVAAFWFTAEDKEQRRRVIALMGSAALISFLTGITEPIEFAFLFIAPALFGLHVILSGLAAFVTGLFGIQLGFGFSAGLLDYGLSIPKSLQIIEANKTGVDAVFANPGWIWPIGAVTAAAYFGAGSFIIKKFNIPVPGRGKGRIENDEEADESASASSSSASGGTQADVYDIRAAKYVKALGGYDNITNFQNCTTRLRYDVKSNEDIDPDELAKAGAKGVVKVGKNHIQVVVGLDVEALNNAIIKGRDRQ